MNRRAASLAVVAFIAATAGGVAVPALAADSCDGVWVVVDARTAGGPLTSRCTPGDPGSGIRALTGAGHEVAYVPSQPGLVCTIEARPDPCNGAPSDAHWSYWYASAGGSWTYSNVGAGARDPAPGTVEGWRFGDGSAPPGTAPPSNEAPEPEPEPTPEPDPDPAPAASTEPRSGSSGAASSNDPATGGAAASAAEDSEQAPETPDLREADEPEPATPPDADDPGDDDPGDDDPGADPNAEDPANEPDTDDPGANEPDAGSTDRGGDALEAPDPATLDGSAAGQDPALADGDGSPWGLILAVALVGAIGGTTLHRRHQPRQPRREVG